MGYRISHAKKNWKEHSCMGHQHCGRATRADCGGQIDYHDQSIQGMSKWLSELIYGVQYGYLVYLPEQFGRKQVMGNWDEGAILLPFDELRSKCKDVCLKQYFIRKAISQNHYSKSRLNWEDYLRIHWGNFIFLPYITFIDL